MSAALKKGSLAERIEVLANHITEICELEYERGSREMFERLAAIAQKHKAKPALSNIPKRAPKGAATKFVNRIVSSEPRTIREIMGEARTDLERSLSYQVVRLALERGRQEGLYKKTKDRWLRA